MTVPENNVEIDDQTENDANADDDAAADTPDDRTPSTPLADIDLDAMTADLDGVDAALVRLADGTYWTDEVTGEPIPTEVLEADPIARRC